MSKLNSLIGKPKTFKIGGIELELKPRTIKDIDVINRFAEPETRGQAMRELIVSTLKEAVPDATDEEIDSISFKYFQELTEAILEVNGFKNVKQ